MNTSARRTRPDTSGSYVTTGTVAPDSSLARHRAVTTSPAARRGDLAGRLVGRQDTRRPYA
ncbi:hypothetical protein [Streptomyces sp. bgisy031]|uniref:hypothetical protein n=1 Tax=Streptomyces sp. bgisy031 TaxID=3413772 RepID=UPI003D75A494